MVADFNLVKIISKVILQDLILTEFLLSLKVRGKSGLLKRMIPANGWRI
jgi:hypothetical protein